MVTQAPQNLHDRYHAHVYFDAQTLAQAEGLCHQAGERFNLPVGRVHQKPVGPHPAWSCQISFESAQFDELIAWLEQHRNGLMVLVHGVTGNDLADHTDHAAWLGTPQELNLSMLS